MDTTLKTEPLFVLAEAIPPCARALWQQYTWLLGCLYQFGEGPFFILSDDTPIKRDRFVWEVRPVLASVYTDHQDFTSLSFWIEVANMVTKAIMLRDGSRILEKGGTANHNSEILKGNDIHNLLVSIHPND